MSQVQMKCGCCGKSFDELPLDIGMAKPGAYVCKTKPERAALRRFRMNSDLAIWTEPDGAERQFVRGLLPVPILGTEDKRFGWGFWAEVEREPFETLVRGWNNPTVGVEFEGRLSVEHIIAYPGLDGAAVAVRVEPEPARPTLWLAESAEATDGCRALRADQREGISLEKAHGLLKVVALFS